MYVASRGLANQGDFGFIYIIVILFIVESFDAFSHSTASKRIAMVRIRVVDRRLFAGEVSALLSGELLFKITKTVTAPDWTIQSEFIGNDWTHLSHAAADGLLLDSLLLVGGWCAASLVTHGCFGFAPASRKARWDDSLTLVINAANVILLSVLIASYLLPDVPIDDLEALTAISLGAVLSFRALTAY